MELMGGDGQSLYQTTPNGLKKVRDFDGNRIDPQITEPLPDKPTPTGDWKKDEIAKVEWMMQCMENNTFALPWTKDCSGRFPYSGKDYKNGKSVMATGKSGAQIASFLGNLLTGTILAANGSWLSAPFISNALSKIFILKRSIKSVHKHQSKMKKQLNKLKATIDYTEDQTELQYIYGNLEKDTKTDFSAMKDQEIHGSEDHQEYEFRYRVGQTTFWGMATACHILLAIFTNVAWPIIGNAAFWSFLSGRSAWQFNKNTITSGKAKVNSTIYEGLELEKYSYKNFVENEENVMGTTVTILDEDVSGITNKPGSEAQRNTL